MKDVRVCEGLVWGECAREKTQSSAFSRFRICILCARERERERLGERFVCVCDVNEGFGDSVERVRRGVGGKI